ncbi:hypothetical protein M434DRAFT_401625 [Hypoxylon sp. CO27-5]|nr:hypothetical protein M434DRAFT_401625 [Hypoxylon sp. CO27-5]
MASNGVSEGSVHIPERAPAVQPSRIPVEEDESEWEYEYSKTETETFYVTLDLSKADFTSREAVNVNRPGYRGGEKAERAKLYLNRRMSPSNSNDNSPDNSDEDGDVPRNLKHPERQNQLKEATDDGDDHQVQILELHSEHPVISYKGRVYSGQWSQNVGTEFLITKRDEDNPLPVLRHLDHDVELLAASCARITVKEKQLKPKEDPKRPYNANSSRERSAVRHLVPPAERWATRERVEQGNFLANFIALKKRRGETDDVTVISKSVERPDRNRSRKNKQKQRQGHRGKYNLPHYRGPRKINRGSDLLKTLSIREQSATPSQAPSADEVAISTPTPRHWDDLEENRENEEGQGEEGEGEKEEEEEDDEEDEEEDDEKRDEDEAMNDADEEDEDEENVNEYEDDGELDMEGSRGDDSAEEMDIDDL